MKIINGIRFHALELAEPQITIILGFLEEGAHRQVRPIIDAIIAQLPKAEALSIVPKELPPLPEGADYDRVGGSSTSQ